MNNHEKTRLQKLLSNGNIQEVINILLSLNINKSKRKEILAISSRYKKLKRKDNSGIISFEQMNITENKIIINLVDLINSPNDQPYPKEKSIDNLHPPKTILWKYITASAIVIGILGSLAVLLNSINTFPSSTEKLQLNVFVTDIKGNVVLEHEGELNIPLGDRSLNKPIGTDGKTNFSDIIVKNKGDTIEIGLNAEGWEIADGNNTFVFTGDPIQLKVKRDNSLGIIKGVVKSRNGQKFIPEAEVRIGNDTIIFTDSSGIFKVILPEKMRVKKDTDGYLLTVSKNGYKIKTQYHYPKSSNAEIRLEK